MRRWILVLLMAVLPLQFAQAAAAAYCAHEKTVTKQHLGHHEHEHQASAADTAASSAADTDGDSSPSAGADTDCEYCHLSCAQPLGSAATSWTGTREQPAVHSPTLAFDSLDGVDVERPNWSSAARSAGGGVSITT